MTTKEIKIHFTSCFINHYGEIRSSHFAQMISEIFEKFKYDMFVLEMTGNSTLQVRLAGYDFDSNALDEATIIHRTEETIDKPFWFKIDDYGDYYLGTFLFPEEY